MLTPKLGKHIQSQRDDQRDGFEGMDPILPALRSRDPGREAAPVPPGVSAHAGGEAQPSPPLPCAPASPRSYPMTGCDCFTPQALAVG